MAESENRKAVAGIDLFAGMLRVGMTPSSEEIPEGAEGNGGCGHRGL